MRSSRSFLILVVVALGIGAYAYFVDSKKDLTDTSKKKPKVVTVEAAKIDELEIHSATGGVTTAKKTNDNWQIVAPETMDADGTELSSVASTIESLEAQRTVDEQPKALEAFGLAPARFSVAYKVTGDAAWHRLNFGSKTPAGSNLYAQVEGQPKVILISAYVEESLNRTSFDLRDKTVLKFAREGADALTLEPAGGPAVTLAKKGADWLMTKPVAAKADFASVDNILSRIGQSKMKALVVPGSRPAPAKPNPAKAGKDAKDSADATKKDATKKDAAKPEPASKPDAAAKPDTKPGATYSDADLKAYGLDKPEIVATIGAGSAKSSIAIGGKFDDQTVYARDLSRPIVFTVEKGLADDLKKKADDLRIKDVFEFRGFTASAIEITYGGSTYSFDKKTTAAKDPSAAATDEWKQTKPAEKAVDQTKFNDLLTNLSNLRADKFADKPAASGEEIVVVAKFGEGGTPTKEDHVILRKTGTTVQAIHPGDSSPAIVPTAEFDKILAQVKELAGKK